MKKSDSNICNTEDRVLKFKKSLLIKYKIPKDGSKLWV